MLNPHSFSAEWLKLHQEAIGAQNPIMLEKAIMALQLLGHLAETNLPFQFKGGTSLLLRITPIRRLSIDVDIVTQATEEGLRGVLDGVAKLQPFTGYQHDTQRDKELPPKRHFRFFYPSVIEPKSDHILLDVLLEPEPVPNCEPVIIAAPFIQRERDVPVHVPTVNGLLGDKLTAFAPNTIGILYNAVRKTDIAKQLFDVGALFDHATDLAVAAEVYAATHAKQLAYRNAAYSLPETLNDSIQAGCDYSQLDLQGGSRLPNALMLQDGVASLQNHLVNYPFSRDHARIAAGKAACIAAWIQRQPPDLAIEHLRFDPKQIESLRALTIEAPWTPLNRLKGGNPEAFHYWHIAQQILNT
jgi:hypothetical protein